MAGCACFLADIWDDTGGSPEGAIEIETDGTALYVAQQTGSGGNRRIRRKVIDPRAPGSCGDVENAGTIVMAATVGSVEGIAVAPDQQIGHLHLATNDARLYVTDGGTTTLVRTWLDGGTRGQVNGSLQRSHIDPYHAFAFVWWAVLPGAATAAFELWDLDMTTSGSPTTTLITSGTLPDKIVGPGASQASHITVTTDDCVWFGVQAGSIVPSTPITWRPHFIDTVAVTGPTEINVVDAAKGQLRAIGFPLPTGRLAVVATDGLGYAIDTANDADPFTCIETMPHYLASSAPLDLLASAATPGADDVIVHGSAVFVQPSSGNPSPNNYHGQLWRLPGNDPAIQPMRIGPVR